MASTQRYIDTRFWSDVWVRKLNALDRYVFLYFLTNQHSSWCGVYELDIAMAAFELGIDAHDLETAILPRLAPKILFVDGWVYIKNFERYHANGSEKTQKGIQVAWDAVPERIRLKIKELGSIEIPHQRGMQGVSSFTSTLTSTSNGEAVASRVKSPKAKKKHNVLGEQIIKAFEAVDAANKRYYGNTTQREACDWLIDQYGLDLVLQRVNVLPKTNVLLYFPRIYSPVQLRDKWQRLEDKVKEKQQEITSKKSNVAFVT